MTANTSYVFAVAAWTTRGPVPTILPSTNTGTPGGAVVNYSLPPVIVPDCPFCCLAVVCTPPSGSLFPIGTTTVHCMGHDGCGENPTCSFTVTVLQPFVYGGLVEYFRDMVFNYPTLAEAYKVAALDGLNKV